MQKFRVINKNNKIIFDKNDEYHITKVLRKKINDTIECYDNNGSFLITQISSINPLRVTIKQETKIEIEPYPITAYIGLIKKNNFELIVEKLNELNISKIVPVVFSRSQNNIYLDYKRLNRIVVESCKQSNRVNPLIIENQIKFDELLEKIKGSTTFLCSEKETSKNINNYDLKIKNGDIINFIIGCEGGFTIDELNQLNSLTLPITLTKTILRSETAAIYTASILIERLKYERN
ncbi:RsmE family RNA methyltransferase [Malacoplasma iowae]|uniref:Ribosomal RNA small subunit methyltransferase E n=1 Tax=Malacoplasma iowae 695 TaxID=1048830 RepID=A0A6P1LNE6_MALIO|nr:RsmE family RNA methyltransferase [Malacoplasma iowae]QHG90042.1 16S rRNA (uracil(1498)-N(3))-methyltransferase [Malacoplasma iowae 695]WPL36227.1 RsmE family RNA methyltransferase [Malacoplasma iowae]VEU61954.1 RsmE family RNA methyltransferase [Mycoplasmopsis fermentans]VEU70765.1 RsmE family RNA methyltransferase [Malacoplasma iowae]